ncbi:MAG: NUDIX hydrolase [Bacteroidetes bacterium]|nr:MAG: NUDIX hydrolase [Bacteroidota bacterium]
MTFTYKYPRPALTVDAVVFRKTPSKTEVLLIQRKNPPFQGEWALPGGFVDMDETLETAVARELFEETGLTNILLKQMHAFSTPGRDPRGHTISVVFWGILEDDQTAKAGDDAQYADWFDLNKLPKLAFDHQDVVEMAMTELKHQITKNK